MMAKPPQPVIGGPPPPELVAQVAQQNCGHMILARVRTGSPVLVCGACPTYFIMARTGVFIAMHAAEADTLAQDLVGVKRLTEIGKSLEPKLVLP